MVDVELGFCQTNHAFACDWSFDCRVVVGKRRWRRVDPQPLDQFTGGWKFFFFQCICIGHRGFYVFRHAHRNPNPAGAHSFRHGKRPCIGSFVAGPSLSLPNMLVIRSVLGNQKTIIYVTLVVVMATVTGLIFGSM